MVPLLAKCYYKNLLDKKDRYVEKYYEIFGKEIDDINVIYNNLINSLNNEFNYKHNVIYEVVNIPNF